MFPPLIYLYAAEVKVTRISKREYNTSKGIYRGYIGYINMEVDMEKFMFIAFRSREHTVKFFEEMRSRGIVGTVINTPREAEAGCGLSVRFSPRQKNAVLSILERHGFSSFIGVFEATATDGKRFVRPA